MKWIKQRLRIFVLSVFYTIKFSNYVKLSNLNSMLGTSVYKVTELLTTPLILLTCRSMNYQIYKEGVS